MTEIKRTMFAQAGFELATHFDMLFTGLGWASLSLAEPEQSTGGGTAARQSMVLVPAGTEDKIVIGWMNSAEQTGELKCYDLAAQQFEARYHRSFLVDRAAYEQLLSDVENFLKVKQFSYRVAAASARPPSTPRVASSKTPIMVMLALFLALCVLGFGIYVAFGR